MHFLCPWNLARSQLENIAELVIWLCHCLTASGQLCSRDKSLGAWVRKSWHVGALLQPGANASCFTATSHMFLGHPALMMTGVFFVFPQIGHVCWSFVSLGFYFWLRICCIIATVGGLVGISSCVCTVCIIRLTPLSFCTDQKFVPLLTSLPPSTPLWIITILHIFLSTVMSVFYVLYLKSEEEMALKTF